VFWCCWLGGRKSIWPVKNMGERGGGHWLVRMEWRPAGWSVCLPLLIFPCTIKSRSAFLAPAHPDGPRKRAVKRLCVCMCIYSKNVQAQQHPYQPRISMSQSWRLSLVFLVHRLLMVTLCIIVGTALDQVLKLSMLSTSSKQENY